MTESPTAHSAIAAASGTAAAPIDHQTRARRDQFGPRPKGLLIPVMLAPTSAPAVIEMAAIREDLLLPSGALTMLGGEGCCHQQ
jgi:hypothetical protein